MNEKDLKDYDHLRSGGPAFYEQRRGLIAVRGKEAVQFLDGMITNDMKTLGDGEQMLAAFPNAQGRLLAVVRVRREGDGFLFETEEATRDKLFNSLFRFTFAGDFFVEDVSDNFRFAEVWNLDLSASALRFAGRGGTTWAIPNDEWPGLSGAMKERSAVQISDSAFETLRIEAGVPKFGVDMDEATIVPELGLDGMISYTKGCYVGQEIIARIHFRGHVAKQLTGLVSEPGAAGLTTGSELSTPEGKNAGRVTSITYSPRLERNIALAFVRYDHLAEGTELKAGDAIVRVTKLPFIE